ALKAALLEPCALVLLLAPSLRQAGELFRARVLALYDRLDRPVPGEATALELRLGNGSRVLSLPSAEGTVRCYSGGRLLILDEAARVPDQLLRAVRPMLATSQGALVALSSPAGQRGWFWECWSGQDGWERVCVKAHDCPRIPRAFLLEERRVLGPAFY